MGLYVTVLHEVCMNKTLRPLDISYLDTYMVEEVSCISILGKEKAISLDYHGALFEWVCISALMFHCVVMYCAVVFVLVFIQKVYFYVYVIAIFATFHCKLPSFSLYKYIFKISR